MQNNGVGHKGLAKLIFEQQFLHGFTSGRSCLTNLLEMLECWTRMLHEGNEIDVLYLDYQKRFDSVTHRRLIERLKDYGLMGGCWNESRVFSVSDR